MNTTDLESPPYIGRESPVASSGPGLFRAKGQELRAKPARRSVALLPLAVVTLVFFCSRAVYHWVFGAHLDEAWIEYALQTLDTQLLRHDLLRNLFYLHHQVPLWNLVLGVVLKLFPVHHADAFSVVYCALGFGMALSMLYSLRRLGVGPAVRTLATILFCISPPVIAYELWISYHYLCAPLLVMALAALGVFIRTGSRRWGHVFFALVVLVVLARSVYGLSWVAAIVGILLVYRPVPRRLVLRVSAIPLLLVFLNTIKTPIQTGHSLGHALLAPNLVFKILHELPARTKEKLFAEGKLSPISRHYPFFVPSSVPGFAIPLPKTGIPGLDTERKENGQTNANCLQHVYLADLYMKDAKWLLVHYPMTYLGSVWKALSVGYMKAATDVDLMPGTQPYLATASAQNLFAKVMLKDKATGRLWGLVVGLPLSLLYGVLWLLGPKARLPSSRTRTPLIAVMVLTILNTTVTTFLSWGDFSRYRFDADPYFFLLLVLLADGVLGRMRALVTTWRSSRGAGVEAPATPEAARTLG